MWNWWDTDENIIYLYNYVGSYDSVLYSHRVSLFLPYTSGFTMGNLLCSCSLLGSSVPFPVPTLQECRTFEICLHCNDYSWCSAAMFAWSHQCCIWIWINELVTYDMPSSCTRCGFLYRRIVWRIWSRHTRNSAGTCLLHFSEGKCILICAATLGCILRCSHVWSSYS